MVPLRALFILGKFRPQLINPLKYSIPWMTFGAIKWLDGYLASEMRTFEWGSGGSTIFYSKRCEKIVSIEHDTNWFKMVENVAAGDNLTYRLIPPSAGRGYKSSDEMYKGLSFESYCKAIARYPDDYFDLVSVDGRARNSCISEAILKIKVGGCLVLDNSERKEYVSGIRLLKSWRRNDFFGPGPINRYSWQTSIFQKPFKKITKI